MVINAENTVFSLRVTTKNGEVCQKNIKIYKKLNKRWFKNIRQVLNYSEDFDYSWYDLTDHLFKPLKTRIMHDNSHLDENTWSSFMHSGYTYMNWKVEEENDNVFLPTLENMFFYSRFRQSVLDEIAEL